MIESTPVFVDGLGRRVVRIGGPDAAPTEHLLFDPELASHPGFVAALKDRVARVQGMRLSSYARILRVDVDAVGGVTLVSEYVKGWRLADMLDVAESENLTLDIGVVMLLLRQLLPTAGLLTKQSRDVANGALGPEHLLLTPQRRVVPAEHVLGPAIDALGWAPERLWRTLRVATPPSGGGGRAVSHRGDVAQLGVTVLSLVVGRRLRDDEWPERLEDLVGSARQRTPTVVDAPLSTGLRAWLLRALQLQTKSFATLFDAHTALERLLATEASLIAQPTELDVAMAKLERFMPVFDLPTAPPEPVALPEVAASPTDWAPPAPAEWDLPPAAPTVEAVQETADVARPEPAVSEVMVPPAPAPQAPLLVESPAQAPPRPQPVPRPVLDHPPPDPIEAFPSSAVPWWRSSRAVAALVTLALVQAVLLGVQWARPTESLGGDGELVVSSRPAGAEVSVDDEQRGVTPVTMKLAPGTHVMQLRVGASEPRVIPLSIRPGVQTAQYVEFAGVSSTGVLEVRSEPAQARVTIDGQERGSTPLTLRDVTPGDYQVVLERAGWKSTQVVRVEPGVTAQLLVPIR